MACERSVPAMREQKIIGHSAYNIDRATPPYYSGQGDRIENTTFYSRLSD